MEGAFMQETNAASAALSPDEGFGDLQMSELCKGGSKNSTPDKRFNPFLSK